MSLASPAHLNPEREGSMTASEATIPLLEIRGLSQRFRRRGSSFLAFEQIDLQVQPREVVCLLGPSGCGKSSLLLSVAGLQRPTSGEVLLDDQPVTEPQVHVGVVFQSPALLPWLTVSQNVAWSLSLKRMPRLAPQEVSARVSDALASVGLSGFERAHPRELSGGMAQRVALARALVRQPELLLLDEPFSALDAITRRSMQELLLQAIARYGAAALLVTHDIDEALAIGDRVVLMDRYPGRIHRQWSLRSPRGRDEVRSLADPADYAELRREILAELSGVMTRSADTAGSS
mgnify:CR=1 FL=1